jgi:catechol 2,3-dioxygenase-like lactoylglutathione lyase family enzyme
LKEVAMTFDPRITMITLGVADVAASTAFYERLGFVKSSASQDTVTFFRMKGTVLGLFGRASLAEDAGVEDSEPGFSGVTHRPQSGQRGGCRRGLRTCAFLRCEAGQETGKGVLGRLFRLFRRSGRAFVGTGIQSRSGRMTRTASCNCRSSAGLTPL